jgi:pyrimidine operon attenuation protein/uracil phosphoribosyltransferase
VSDTTPQLPGGDSGSTARPAPNRGAALGRTVGRIVLDDGGIRRALVRIAHELLERNDAADRLYLVAIPNGGVPLARQLAENLKSIAGLDLPVGILDTTLYRDDLSLRGERPPLRVTEMPSAVDDRIVVLVDDVANTGRTIRAAMDALMDFGRPRAVQVVALVDRGHRELPIRIDFVGKNIPTQANEKVVLQATEANPDGGLEGALEVVVAGPESPADGRGGER